MRTLRLEVVIRGFYANPPTTLLRRSLDYRYEGSNVVLHEHGARCLGWRVETARRIRRAVRQGRVLSCQTSRLRDISGLECDTLMASSSAVPEPLEILLALYTGYLYRLVEDGELHLSRIAREYEVASCQVVEGSYWWRLLENVLGRRPLRLSHAMLEKHECTEVVHAALIEAYRDGKLSLRRARCYLGVYNCKAVYRVSLPEEVVESKPLNALARATGKATRRLLDLLNLDVEYCSMCIRIGVGSWPLNTLAGLAALNGLMGAAPAETIFSAYRRCGGLRRWPPQYIDVVMERGSKLRLPGEAEVRIMGEY